MKPRFIQPNTLISSTPPPRKYVRALRAAAWNAAFIIFGLLLVAVVGEVYLRLANPFLEDRYPTHFVDGVGLIHPPYSEVRFAEWHDNNFVVSRANSQGFLDREPVSAERAAAGCHIAFIGDSYVEAREVPISDKFHARLEEMAAHELPYLAITTQAYGLAATGQIGQIPFYDEYARRLSPKLVVLVFFLNDFADNSTALKSLGYGVDPDRMPFMSAQRDEHGALTLRPPDPEYKRFWLPRFPQPWYGKARFWLIRTSYFAKWLDIKNGLGWLVDGIKAIDARIGAPVGTDTPRARVWMNIIAERPCCALLDDWQPVIEQSYLNDPFTEEHLPSVIEEALEYTAFGIDQFKRRADRDGATLAILSVAPHMGTQGWRQFDRMSAIAETHGIPVIDNYDYIASQGHDVKDARWPNDGHWNAIGHQWAAEAVLEWLKENPDVCD